MSLVSLGCRQGHRSQEEGLLWGLVAAANAACWTLIIFCLFSVAASSNATTPASAFAISAHKPPLNPVELSLPGDGYHECSTLKLAKGAVVDWGTVGTNFPDNHLVDQSLCPELLQVVHLYDLILFLTQPWENVTAVIPMVQMKK